MKIRELKNQDKKDFINLVKEADNRDAEWGEQKFKNYVSNKKKKIILVCEENNRLIGFVGLKAQDIGENVESDLNDNYVLITWIVLIPEARGKGIGSELLLECEKYSKKWHKKGIWLGCRDKVIPFYEKNGYKKAGTFINDRGKQENLMLKNIN